MATSEPLSTKKQFYYTANVDVKDLYRYTLSYYIFPDHTKHLRRGIFLFPLNKKKRNSHHQRRQADPQSPRESA